MYWGCEEEEGPHCTGVVRKRRGLTVLGSCDREHSDEHVWGALFQLATVKATYLRVF